MNLFDACGQAAVHFHVTITDAVAADDGGAGAGDAAEMVERTLLDRAGELIAVQANPADDKGLFVTEYTF